jgi:Transglutaminase-like superfamily/Domain of Unknown Function with PDB structure (DUF3857)
MKSKLVLAAFFCSLVLTSISQEKSKAKFGKITPEDFRPTSYAIDTSAEAVILADIGSTEIVGNDKNGCSLQFNNYRRARIMKRSGYDIANIEINLYADGDAEEKLQSLKAVTYNLENGKVVETKLDVKNAVFKEKIDKNRVIKKFTFPNIKEGSIIEYDYEVESDFLFNLQGWAFQGGEPRIWSEYNVAMPEFLYYVTLTQGYQSFAIRDHKDSRASYTFGDAMSGSSSDRSTFTTGVTYFRWVMKDVPALKPESFTSTISNHIAKIEFQLAEYRAPFRPQNVMGTWVQASEHLLTADYFGASLNKDNGWLSGATDDATKGAVTDVDKAKNIYAYVRDNMTCTGRYGRYIETTLKSVLKGRNGNEAEINLLLTAMLRKAGFLADPVLLSTRNHGYAYSLYPLMDRFNYVITLLRIDGKDYYLDASLPNLGFGRLNSDCYNGHARVINETATPLEFSADSLVERKMSSIFIINDAKGNLDGSMQQSPGYFESEHIRDVVKDKGQPQLFNDIKKAFNADITLTKPVIDSLNKLEEPVFIRYDFSFSPGNEDVIYINPMFGESWRENPFKSAERLYPVEMPYARDEVYILQMEVPKGYVIDEMPKQMVVKLNEQEDGIFEYRLSESNGIISLRSRLQLKRAYFQPDEYESLREFFNLVVKKHAEQIVFKKKK